MIILLGYPPVVTSKLKGIINIIIQKIEGQNYILLFIYYNFAVFQGAVIRKMSVLI